MTSGLMIIVLLFARSFYKGTKTTVFYTAGVYQKVWGNHAATLISSDSFRRFSVRMGEKFTFQTAAAAAKLSV
jgi:hypothetical protein